MSVSKITIEFEDEAIKQVTENVRPVSGLVKKMGEHILEPLQRMKTAAAPPPAEKLTKPAPPDLVKKTRPSRPRSGG